MYFFSEQALGGLGSTLVLEGEDYRHCVQSLRKRVGDVLHLFDAYGVSVEAVIRRLDKRSLLAEVLVVLDSTKVWRGYKHLAVAITKHSDRLEWLLEKAVEMGLDRFTPLLCRHGERSSLRRERLERVIRSAAKQSGNIVLPQLDQTLTLEVFLKQKAEYPHYLAHCRPGDKPVLHGFSSRDACLLIGPEGDFSLEELDLAASLGCQMVALGASRLRTETAALLGLAWLHTMND